LGLDFRKILTERVTACDVFLAVIGDKWLSVTGPSGGRRLDDTDDYVRIEIEGALSRHIPVIPVLVGNSSVPKAEELPETLQALAHRQATLVRPDPDFHHDVERLFRGIEEAVAARSAPEPEAAAWLDRKLLRLGLASAAVLGVLAFGIVLFAVVRDKESSTPNLAGVASDGPRVATEIEDQTARRRQLAEKAAGEPAKKPSPRGGRIIYVEEFINKRTGLSKDLTARPDPNPGVSDRVFYFYAATGVPWRLWDIRRFETECTCEVVGRVTGDDRSRDAGWSVLLLSASGTGRGFRVNINIKGELFVTPSPWRGARAYVNTDPRIGPVTHPAIKPGSAYNNLLLTVRTREVVIIVNGSQVAEPVKLEYDVTPAKLQLGVYGPGNKLAEFDRVEIRELADHAADKPKIGNP
jgi:hypothetical protein